MGEQQKRPTNIVIQIVGLIFVVVQHHGVPRRRAAIGSCRLCRIGSARRLKCATLQMVLLAVLANVVALHVVDGCQQPVDNRQQQIALGLCRAVAGVHKRGDGRALAKQSHQRRPRAIGLEHRTAVGQKRAGSALQQCLRQLRRHQRRQTSQQRVKRNTKSKSSSGRRIS